MKIIYNKLWKLLIDKKMRKQDLQREAGISSTSIAKLAKGENIQTDTLIKICKVFNCDISAIMEIDFEDE